MRNKKQESGLARESPPAYAGGLSNIVTMSFETMDVGERHMLELKEKARVICEALRASDIPHAVVGGMAVSAHVCQVDASAERNTKDLDILLLEHDLERAAQSLQTHGFKLRKVLGVSVVKAGQKVRAEYAHPAPEPPLQPEFYSAEGFPCIDLANLLVMKLTSFRLKDQVHVQDMLELGLITRKIEKGLPSDLQARLREVKEISKRERLG